MVGIPTEVTSVATKEPCGGTSILPSLDWSRHSVYYKVETNNVVRGGLDRSFVVFFWTPRSCGVHVDIYDVVHFSATWLVRCLPLLPRPAFAVGRPAAVSTSFTLRSCPSPSRRRREMRRNQPPLPALGLANPTPWGLSSNFCANNWRKISSLHPVSYVSWLLFYLYLPFKYPVFLPYAVSQALVLSPLI